MKEQFDYVIELLSTAKGACSKKSTVRLTKYCSLGLGQFLKRVVRDLEGCSRRNQ